LDLVFSQECAEREQALAAERRIKGWRREKKEALIAGEYHLLPALARTASHGSNASGSAGSPRTVEAGSESGDRVASGSTGSPRTVEEGGLTIGNGPESAGTALASFSAADERWMRHALVLADRAEREDDEIPVGAVLVDARGQLLAEGSNRNISENDATAHAEIVAMRQAGMRLGNHRLLGSTLYVTLEPCAMCAMAMVHARVARVVFAAADPKTGAAGSVFDLLADPRHNHRIQVQGGLLAEEAASKLTRYFKGKRGKLA
jgi:tRNA(Arg) A34 adenosine deaminase TadA